MRVKPVIGAPGTMSDIDEEDLVLESTMSADAYENSPPYADYTPPRAATATAATATAATATAAMATAKAAASPKRTLPVAKGLASPEEKTYSSGELFQFYVDSANNDVLGIGDRGAGKWMSPTAPFPIKDSDNPDVEYPTVNHYLAAMRYRQASNTPEIATSVFSRQGSIHQKYTRLRVDESEGGKKPIPEKRDQILLKEEDAEVRDAIRPIAFKRFHSTFDEAKWASKKDAILKEALRQRWENDARFRKIVEAARDKGKTLLYYAPGANFSDLGGVHRSTGIIQGENRMGKIIMELAGF
jgi:predicted NAD-dependent protein-ADP-ribosyltransferase YbiA (DUF1768 family)